MSDEKSESDLEARKQAERVRKAEIRYGPPGDLDPSLREGLAANLAAQQIKYGEPAPAPWLQRIVAGVNEAGIPFEQDRLQSVIANEDIMNEIEKRHNKSIRERTLTRNKLEFYDNYLHGVEATILNMDFRYNATVAGLPPITQQASLERVRELRAQLSAGHRTIDFLRQAWEEEAQKERAREARKRSASQVDSSNFT